MIVLGDRNNYLLFDSYDAFNRFMSRKTNPVVEDAVEYCRMEKYPVSRILFTAEHDKTEKVPLREISDTAYAGLGDTNTGTLAKIGAYYLRTAYLIPNFVRTDADPSRPPEDLGRGLRLFVKQKRTGNYPVSVLIHKKTSMMPKLMRYHEVIEQMNPKFVLSVHGVSEKREQDIIFGFGKEYNYIGGKKEAFRFRDEFSQELDRAYNSIGITANLNIEVSTWRFLGHKNYVLSNHVTDHNLRSDEKRMGIQVEFNLKGRVSKHDEKLPTIPYQMAIQVLGDFVYKWNNSKNGQ